MKHRIRFILAISAAMLLLRLDAFVVLKSASTRTKTTPKRQHRLSTQDDDEIARLYRSVAETDPEWYQEFVVNTLGQSGHHNDIPYLVDLKKSEGETKTVETVTRDKDYSTTKDNNKRLLAVVGVFECDVNFVSENDGDKETAQSKLHTTTDDRNADIVSKDNRLFVEEQVAVVSETRYFGDENAVRLQEAPAKQEPPAKILATDTIVTKASGRDLREDKLLRVEQALSVNKQQEASSWDKELAFVDDTKHLPNKTDNNPSRHVVLNCTGSDGPIRIPPHALESDLSTLTPDSLRLLERDKIRKRRVGIPARWTAKDREVSSMITLADDITMDIAGSQTEESAVNATAAAIDEHFDLERTKRSKNTSVVDVLNETFSSVDKPIEVDKLKESIRKKEAFTPASNASSDAADLSAHGKEPMVLYTDPDGDSWVTTPLAKFVNLGYIESDIKSIDPSALNLIALERIRKPKTGIPSSWAMLDSSSEILILPADEATLFLDRHTIMVNATKVLPIRATNANDRNRLTVDKLDDELPSLKNDSLASQKVEPDAVNTVPSRARRGRSRRGDPSKRKIYSGRTTKTTIIADPPPPKSNLWPDIDTFRSLLRSEASLRLRILGEDWAPTVKEESDWRLNLYKKWLWTLHHGVGAPMVESRSDRMRRLSRRDRPSEAQQPTKQRPTPRERRKRNSPN
jgi:hypothetical protein